MKFVTTTSTEVEKAQKLPCTWLLCLFNLTHLSTFYSLVPAQFSAADFFHSLMTMQFDNIVQFMDCMKCFQLEPNELCSGYMISSCSSNLIFLIEMSPRNYIHLQFEKLIYFIAIFLFLISTL